MKQNRLKREKNYFLIAGTFASYQFFCNICIIIWQPEEKVNTLQTKKEQPIRVYLYNRVTLNALKIQRIEKNKKETQ